MLEKHNLVSTSVKFVSVGQVFGRLTVLAVGTVRGTYRYKCVCRCECGEEKVVRADALVSGVTTSCGCYHKERTTTHGKTSSGHYSRWRQMMDRCYNPENPAYLNYGGRGIKVCEAWHDIKNFVDQLPDGYRKGLEIDRINNDGNYEPNNVRWATRQKNSSNRRSCHYIEHLGRVQTLKQWATEYGLNNHTLWERIVVWEWPVEKALTTPPINADERMAKARAIRWAGHVKKPQPKPRTINTVVVHGEVKNLFELSEMTGVSRKLLYKQLFERHWPIEKVLQKAGYHGQEDAGQYG